MTRSRRSTNSNARTPSHDSSASCDQQFSICSGGSGGPGSGSTGAPSGVGPQGNHEVAAPEVRIDLGGGVHDGADHCRLIFGASGRTATAMEIPRNSSETGRGPAQWFTGAAFVDTIAAEEEPPLRWVAGADAVAAVEQKAKELLAQVEAYRDLSSSLGIDERQVSGVSR